MQLKPGVRTFGARPELVLALVIANEVYAMHGQSMVVTSITEGVHSRASIHYTGGAADLRLTPKAPEICGVLRERLGDDFDVVLEPDHIHIEWQPKQPYR